MALNTAFFELPFFLHFIEVLSVLEFEHFIDWAGLMSYRKIFQFETEFGAVVGCGLRSIFAFLLPLESFEFQTEFFQALWVLTGGISLGIDLRAIRVVLAVLGHQSGGSRLVELHR